MSFKTMLKEIDITVWNSMNLIVKGDGIDRKRPW